MSVFKMWMIVLSSIAVFDFAIPFACGIWAKSIFSNESKMEIARLEANSANIPSNLKLSETMLSSVDEPWSEIEIDEEETVLDYYNTMSHSSSFTYNEKFIIPSEYINNKEKINSLLQAKIINGARFIGDQDLKCLGVTDISYYTNPVNRTKYVKIVYTISNDFMPENYRKNL